MLGFWKDVAARWGGQVGLALLLASFAVAPPAKAAEITVTTNPDSPVHAGEFVVPLNKSQILRVDTAVSEILVGNSAIADVLALTDQSIYVLGLAVGSTNLTIYGQGRQLLAVMDLVVSYDVDGLKSKLFEVMPDESIEVRTINGALLLSGSVSNSTRLRQILDIAERYAPGAVTQALSVRGSQQVLLEVRFAEIARNLSRELGFNQSVLFNDAGEIVFSLLSGSFASAANAPATLIGSAGLDTTLGNFTMSQLLTFLESKGLVKTLAEPNLVVLSGETASFLAGGEFPIPVVQTGSGGSDSITIQFREFGVGLSFTPTVITDDLINLVVEPSVTSIDATLGTAAAGVAVPGLSTRRVRTTVELRDGQSFAIAGLIQTSFTDAVSQFPWIGDVPILGALFRSSSWQRSETELVVIVTAHLVEPAPSPNMLATPLDSVVLPHDFELFFLGHIEGAGSGMGGAGHMMGADGGGIAGQYGHIIK